MDLTATDIPEFNLKSKKEELLEKDKQGNDAISAARQSKQVAIAQLPQTRMKGEK